ncbi:MAG TPA: glycine cleavage system protein GcvH [Bacillota bacterium]|nr:glycine cleavage system protein GcvH [Bacillota bacterium]
MVPKNLIYSEEHQWIKKTDNNRVIIGITDYGQNELGDIVFVDLPAVGQKISMGENIFSIESVNSAKEFSSPVSGEVMEVNDDLQYSPEFVNQEPFGKGWIAIIEVNDQSELTHLISADKYGKLISK